MNDSDLILKKWNEIQTDILKNEKFMPFVYLLNDELLVKKCKILQNLQVIVSESLQIGNYIRAAKYMILIDKINNDFSSVKYKIIKEITLMIVENPQSPPPNISVGVLTLRQIKKISKETKKK